MVVTYAAICSVHVIVFVFIVIYSYETVECNYAITNTVLSYCLVHVVVVLLVWSNTKIDFY